MVAPADARDSLHLACVGKVDLGHGQQKFTLTYDDERAGDKRRVTLTLSLKAGKLEGYEVAGIWYGQNLKP